MKVFVSTGFTGRTREDVVKDVERAKMLLIDVFPIYCNIELFNSVEFIHNYDVEPIDDNRLYCLSKAIEKMGECDVIIFMKGWRNYRGCRIENTVAIEFPILSIYEDEDDTD